MDESEQGMIGYYNYYVTFGQKYRREMHPQGMHPDGWCRIVAPSYGDAMKVAFKTFGEMFANLKPEKEFSKSLFPKGELKVIQ